MDTGSYAEVYLSPAGLSRIRLLQMPHRRQNESPRRVEQLPLLALGRFSKPFGWTGDENERFHNRVAVKNPYPALSCPSMILAIWSTSRAPVYIAPLMKKVGVEWTLNTSMARWRTLWMPSSSF